MSRQNVYIQLIHINTLYTCLHNPPNLRRAYRLVEVSYQTELLMVSIISVQLALRVKIVDSYNVLYILEFQMGNVAHNF